VPVDGIWDWAKDNLVGMILTSAAVLVALPVIWAKGVVAVWRLLRLMVTLPDMVNDANDKLAFVYDELRPDNPNGMRSEVVQLRQRFEEHVADSAVHGGA